MTEVGFGVNDLEGAVVDMNHRLVRRPKWGGRHGTVVKGSVKWVDDAWKITYSFLLGYETTLRSTDRWANWTTAMSEYRQHDRTVRERKKLEDFRSVRAVL